jgi:hypothetical protein
LNTFRRVEFALMTRRSHRWFVFGVLLLICALGAASVATGITPYLRDRVVAALNERFDAHVAMESLKVAVFPRPEVNGTGLQVRRADSATASPIITIQSFSGGSGILGLFENPLHLRSVELEGLKINVPPGSVRKDIDNEKAQTVPPRERADQRSGRRRRVSLVVDTIVSRAARLEIASKNPAKLPRVFEIHDLVMRDFRPDGPATFRASLTNPVPKGQIETTGLFGPWLASTPSRTAVKGDYRFIRADLNSIKGLGGILSSTGRYSGVLERIDVRGQTETPDFRIDTGGRPVPLTTQFAALVDGTNGDTFLNDVRATLNHTVINARGAVVRARDVKGRQVALDVHIDKGQIQDLLALVLRSGEPPVTGLVSLATKLVIPAGNESVVDRMRLDGKFTLRRARFTNYDVQKRVATLSKRGRGHTGDAAGERVVSNLAAQFRLRDGIVHFSSLQFAVPGAVVQLVGTYSLRKETMDFSGDLLLDASLSETTTGIKAVLAKMAQPLFRRKNGGSKLPIRVSGTRENPLFGLDLKRALLPGN